MHCIYINADRETRRYVFVRENFEAYADPAWSLHRISAVDANALPLRYWGGGLPRAEKAQFANHVSALEMAVALPGDVMILEEDLNFGLCSAEMIRDALEAANDAPWDLLFTDTCLIGTPDMDGHLEDPQLLRSSESRAYVVNASAKGRLLDYLKTLPLFNTAYHLVLRDLIDQEILSAHVAMSLAASPSFCAGACPAICCQGH